MRRSWRDFNLEHKECWERRRVDCAKSLGLKILQTGWTRVREEVDPERDSGRRRKFATLNVSAKGGRDRKSVRQPDDMIGIKIAAIKIAAIKIVAIEDQGERIVIERDEIVLIATTAREIVNDVVQTHVKTADVQGRAGALGGGNMMVRHLFPEAVSVDASATSDREKEDVGSGCLPAESSSRSGVVQESTEGNLEDKTSPQAQEGEVSGDVQKPSGDRECCMNEERAPASDTRSNNMEPTEGEKGAEARPDDNKGDDVSGSPKPQKEDGSRSPSVDRDRRKRRSTKSRRDRGSHRRSHSRERESESRSVSSASSGSRRKKRKHHRRERSRRRESRRH